MASIEYSLFRAKFIKPSQTSLLHTDLAPRDLFLLALKEGLQVNFARATFGILGTFNTFLRLLGTLQSAELLSQQLRSLTN
jgi:hypothetical protein